MSIGTLSFNDTLRVMECWCGINFALPHSLHYQYLNRELTEVYCPKGHRCVPRGKTPVEKERDAREAAERQVQRLQTVRMDLERQVEHERHATRAQKAAKTRIKNRVHKGVCPCCNRTFENLRRHMSTQHPDFAKETVDA